MTRRVNWGNDARIAANRAHRAAIRTEQHRAAIHEDDWTVTPEEAERRIETRLGWQAANDLARRDAQRICDAMLVALIALGVSLIALALTFGERL